jgi:hypothetical protein
MKTNETDSLLSHTAAHVLREQLKLESESYVDFGIMLKITLITVCLLAGLMSLMMATGLVNIIFGWACLMLFVRLLIGSPVRYRLTKESYQRLMEYLDNETPPASE